MGEFQQEFRIILRDGSFTPQEFDELAGYLVKKRRLAVVGSKKTTHEPCPSACSQYISDHRKAAQKKTFEVIVNQLPVYPHTLRFNSAWARVYLGVADVGRKGVLEALEFGKWFRHRLDLYAGPGSGRCVPPHVSVREAEEY